ncbi:unnamed protein product, partial [marine sediment metagenome]
MQKLKRTIEITTIVIALGALILAVYNFWFLHIRVSEDSIVSILTFSSEDEFDNKKAFSSDIAFINKGNRNVIVSHVSMIISDRKRPYYFPWHRNQPIILEPFEMFSERIYFISEDKPWGSVKHLLDYLWSSPEGTILHANLGFFVVDSSGRSHRISSNSFSLSRDSYGVNIIVG